MKTTHLQSDRQLRLVYQPCPLSLKVICLFSVMGGVGSFASTCDRILLDGIFIFVLDCQGQGNMGKLLVKKKNLGQLMQATDFDSDLEAALCLQEGPGGLQKSSVSLDACKRLIAERGTYPQLLHTRGGFYSLQN